MKQKPTDKKSNMYPGNIQMQRRSKVILAKDDEIKLKQTKTDGGDFQFLPFDFVSSWHTENTIEKDCSSSSSDFVECKSEFDQPKDVDDGYAKSEEGTSCHSASGASVDVKSTVSHTSGLGSATSSNQLSIDAPNSEVVQKILVSREVNDAIFKPGIWAMEQRHFIMR